MPDLVFFYGTLMSGQVNHSVLRPAEFLGRAATAPGYALYDLGEYPALVAAAEGAVVHGELYLVSAPVLACLDEFEGCPELYGRVLITLAGGDQAFAYVMEASRVGQASRIGSGTFGAPAGF